MQTIEADIAYYQRRAEQEVKLAQQSDDPAVVAAHYQLAQLYLDRVANLDADADGSEGD